LQAADRAARAYATTEAMAYYTRAKEIAKTLGDVPALRRAYEGLGNALAFTPELPRAVQVFQDMLAEGEHYNDVLMQISALNKRSNILALRMGQLEQAEPLLLKAEQLARDYQDKAGLGEMFLIRCQISVGSSDFDTAMNYMGDAIQVGKDLDVKEQIAWGLAHLSGTYVFMTRFEEGARVAAEAMELAREIDNREFQADIFTTLALIQWRNGELDASIADSEQAAQIAEQIGLPLFVVIGDWGAGWVHVQRGEYTPAIAAFEMARRAAEPFASFMPFLKVMAEAGLGSAMLAAGADRNIALAYHKHALESSESPVAGMSNGAAWADIGTCALNLGNVELAQSLFERALDYPSFFRLVMKPRSLLGIAEIALQRGNFEAAQERINEARVTTDETGMRPYQPLIALANGNLNAARGAHENAVACFADAERSALEFKMRPTVLAACLAAARSLMVLRRSAEAEKKRAQAQAVIDEMADLISDPELRRAYRENVSLRTESHSVT
jgi:tetratricopeptide (TPR) repeat protein